MAAALALAACVLAAPCRAQSRADLNKAAEAARTLLAASRRAERASARRTSEPAGPPAATVRASALGSGTCSVGGDETNCADIDKNCSVTDQGQDYDLMYCVNHGYAPPEVYRCYATVKYPGGRVATILGPACTAVPTDCVLSSAYVFNPCDD